MHKHILTGDVFHVANQERAVGRSDEDCIMNNRIPVLLLVLWLAGCTHSTVIAPIATDDYVILFSDSKGYDVPRMGQIVGRVFYLYERGEVLEFALIYGQKPSFSRRFQLSATQLAQLHQAFEESAFVTYPEAFPSPPIRGPSGSTGIHYRNPGTGELKKVGAYLSQDPDGYPIGFQELYAHLRLVFYGE
jgi:hypothetical protein